MLTEKPRAFRNNNPGNLRDFGIAWKGMTGADEQGYCIFKSGEWGFRALAVDLYTKWSSERVMGKQGDGLKTVGEIIPKFAPPSDNNPTEAYVKNVCTALAVEKDTPLDLNNGDTLEAFCRAIAVQEAGAWLFLTYDLQVGVMLALDAVKARTT